MLVRKKHVYFFPALGHETDDGCYMLIFELLDFGKGIYQLLKVFFRHLGKLVKMFQSLLLLITKFLVLLLGCKHGDDYQCHFIKGSELSEIRLSKVSETLDRLALESERVRFEAISIVDYDKLPALLDEFAESIQEIGPNPFKGW